MFVKISLIAVLAAIATAQPHMNAIKDKAFAIITARPSKE